MAPKPRVRVLSFMLVAALLAHAQPALEWQHPLGGTGDEEANAIQQTTDGGYIMAGWTGSNDGDVTGNHGGSLYGDAWVVKLDGSGISQWQHALGGTGDDVASAIQQTTDGGYIMAGWSGSYDGDVSGNHGGGDAWVIKLDGNGTLQWQRALGGTDIDAAVSVQQTTDGGYIMAGITGSNDGDVSGNHGGTVHQDAWLVKLGGTGNIQWQHALGGTYIDVAGSVQQTTDGGYIIAGGTGSNDGDVSGGHGGWDAWVVNLDNIGSLQWQHALGGTGSDWAYGIQQTTDGGYIMAGYTSSNDGDVSGNHGSDDAWIVKLGPDVGIVEQLAATHVALYPNPAADVVHVQFQLANAAPVVLSMLDAAGRLAGTFSEVRLAAGQHELSYSLNTLPPGVYELRLEVDGMRVARKVVKR